MQAVGKKEAALANKWFIPVDIFPAWAVMVTQDICFMCSNPPSAKKRGFDNKKNPHSFIPRIDGVSYQPPFLRPQLF